MVIWCSLNVCQTVLWTWNRHWKRSFAINNAALIQFDENFAQDLLSKNYVLFQSYKHLQTKHPLTILKFWNCENGKWQFKTFLISLKIFDLKSKNQTSLLLQVILCKKVHILRLSPWKVLTPYEICIEIHNSARTSYSKLKNSTSFDPLNSNLTKLEFDDLDFQ